MFISRITKDNREQLTREHLQECAKYAGVIGKKFGASEICHTVALYHDLGKFTSKFVDYLKQSSIAEKLGNKPIGKGTVIHATQGAIYLNESQLSTNDLIEALVKEIAAICIANHHGSLMDCLSPYGETPLRDRLEQENKNLYYNEVIQAAEKEHVISNDILDIIGKCKAELTAFIEKCKLYKLNIPFMLHLLTKIIFSCLVDADRYNAYCFETNTQMEDAIKLPLWEEYALVLENTVTSFPTVFDIDIIRRNISESCLKAAERPKGIYRLEVPTGGGKTLSSLRFALNHAKKHQMEHIVYVIPYLSVVEQTAKNIRDALHLHSNENIILEHHSNYVISDNTEEAQTYRLLTDRWDSPIIITTMVQFLESIYSHKSSDLRKFHNMANTVFVFDEIQSLPLKCTYLFNEVINFLHYCAGCSVLLCTATQPPLDDIQRPIHMSSNPSIITDMNEDFNKLRRTHIKDCTIPGGYSTEALQDFILEKFKNEKNCLVILNTKRDAAKLFKSLQSYVEANPQEQIELIHLSTGMCPAHRLDRINLIKELKCKNIICISTQLIEAGVDISFNCVIRAIAGLDSIAQAAGRCNRNGEDPNGKNVYIVNISEENLSMLPDIKCGADITYRILAENPSDLMSSATINRYYNEFFYKRKLLMSYPDKDVGNIYDLLSINQKGFEAYKNIAKKNPPALRQAFRTAGELFSVIEQRTTSVFVPYKTVSKLLQQFRCVDVNKKRVLLRKIGQYSVSLYPYQINMLNDIGALNIIEDGLLELDERYYDNKRGVIFDAKVDFWIF